MTDADPMVLDARTPSEWEQWLESNHEVAQEVWLRLFNKNAPESGVDYCESVEIALCYGWIDSMARRYDEVSRIQRFSPRRKHSMWSASNVERVRRMVAEGRMRPAGQHEVDLAKADGRWPS